MKRIIGGLCACACVGALVLPAGASARATHHPSDLFFVDSDTVGDTIWVLGVVDSSRKCTPNRTVKISYNYLDGEGFVPVDVAKSSQTGFFGGAGPATQNGNTADVAKFKLEEKTYRKNGQKHVCDGDTLVVD
jgi:hypothetical protein